MTSRLPPLPATRRCLAAAGFMVLFLALAADALVMADGSALLPLVEACCLLPIAVVGALELRPGLAQLRDLRAWRASLAALPETAHPLGL
jgi:hypothetical protein